MDFTIEYRTENELFRRLGMASEVFEKRLREFIQSNILFAEREIKDRTPQGVLGMQGGLRGRIFSEMRGTPASPIGIVSAPSEYAEVVEEGRRPGQRMPPSSALVTWVEKKLGVPEEHAAGVAFVIARSIGKRGFAGAHMFREGVKATMAHMEHEAAQLGIEIKSDLEK